MASFPGGTSQSPKCRQITPDFHHGGAEIHSHGNIYSGYRWTFPASTAIHGLTRMPYLPSYILHSIVSHQVTSYHSKEVQPWGLPHGINWSYHIPTPHPPPGRDWPKEKEEWLTEVSLWYQLVDSILQEWGSVL